MEGLIYNVTTKVAYSIEKDWLSWLKGTHIPKMIATGCFNKAVILKLKGAQDEDGPTYAVQYHAANEQDYEKYQEEFSSGLRNEALEKWNDKTISFRTVLEVVN